MAARKIFQDLKTTMTTEKEMTMAGVRLVHGTIKGVLITSENYCISWASTLQNCVMMARLLQFFRPQSVSL